MQKKTHTVCVFCGSKSGNNIKYLKLANTLGKKLAERNFNVIYGGGNSGLMGELAEGVLAKNGSLISVIPKFFKNKMDIINMCEIDQRTTNTTIYTIKRMIYIK